MTASSKPEHQFMLGNEAIARSALESGVHFVSGYPGTPSSEIIRTIVSYADEANVHVEWSVNEKVACEGAAAAAFAGLNTMACMKNAGLSVALDFLIHLSMTGLGNNGGAMVAVVCDDPDGHSSGDETDSRWQARFSYAPLLEPSSIAEAKEQTEAEPCHGQVTQAPALLDLGRDEIQGDFHLGLQACWSKAAPAEGRSSAGRLSRGTGTV